MNNYAMMSEHYKCSYRRHHPTHGLHQGGGAANNSAAMGRNSANIGGWRPPPPDRRVRRRPQNLTKTQSPCRGLQAVGGGFRGPPELEVQLCRVAAESQLYQNLRGASPWDGE